MITDKAYLSATTVTNFSRSFYLQDGGKNQLATDMEQNYVTVTLCIQGFSIHTSDTVTTRVYGPFSRTTKRTKLIVWTE